jgi:aspartate kinase
MKVFKFGGASVKDAAAVKNVAKILSEYKNEKIVVVVSAMAKTTNALENIVTAFVNHKPEKDYLS